MNTEKKYVLKTVDNQQDVDRLTCELGIDPILSTLLIQRGIRTFTQAKSFFRPSIDDLYDPFLMTDMDKAVERLHKAIEEGEKILIYGDYDVDGTTAVALVYSFLKDLTSKIDFYIPDRYDEGYGVSYKGIDHAFEDGVGLVITLDCGIKAIEKVEYASQKGIDMIICDHHFPEDTLPKAVAVLDPKREDCHYPFDDLSGCGVGFKLVQAYAQKYGIDFNEKLFPLLDLLVVSIASDLVSVMGENRILAHFGLQRLNEAPRKGLKTMISMTGIDSQHITIDDIVFKIGPRINAAGRMESGRVAVELLTAATDEAAIAAATQINDFNTERKNKDREITKEALEMVTSGNCLSSQNCTIVYNASWHKGIVGIVASRLVEAYYKPTVVFTKSNGMVTGSARSIAGFDLYSAIESCADLLENFGGHLYAAGLTLKEENLEEFCKRMEKFAGQNITPQVATPIVDVDAKIDFSAITPKFTRILKQFQPFGPDNNAPVFLTEDVYDYGGAIRKVGADGGHLKLELIQENSNTRAIPSIAFNKASEFYDYMRNGNPVDVCYSIVENYYKGASSIQLRVKELRKSEDKGII